MSDFSNGRPRSIVLLGVPISSRNQGVQALGASLVNLCAGTTDRIRILTGNACPAEVVYQTESGPINVEVVNYRLSPKSALREHLAWIVLVSLLYRALPISVVRRAISRRTPWISALEECDFAGDIRGGDSFSDIYGMKRFLTGFLAAWTVVLVKGSMVQFPQTYGPYKSGLARFLARFLLRNSAMVVARDKESRRIAQELAGASREVVLSPDVAFSLRASRPEPLKLFPAPEGKETAGVIGLNVNGLMYHGGYTRSNMFGLKMDYPVFLNKLLSSLLDEQDGEVWLVPHTYAPEGDVESDPDASVKLRDALPESLRKRVRIVAEEYDQHEVKGVIGMCDFFVGSRMHSCIAALSQGVPCVGVAYSMKFLGVFESVGMEDWVVDGRQTGDDDAVMRILELYRSRDRIRKPLGDSADRARQCLGKVFGEMMVNMGLPARRDFRTGTSNELADVMCPGDS